MWVNVRVFAPVKLFFFFLTVYQGKKNCTSSGYMNTYVSAQSANGHFHFSVFNCLSNYKSTAHIVAVNLQIQFAMFVEHTISETGS